MPSRQDVYTSSHALLPLPHWSQVARSFSGPTSLITAREVTLTGVKGIGLGVRKQRSPIPTLSSWTDGHLLTWRDGSRADGGLGESRGALLGSVLGVPEIPRETGRAVELRVWV